MMLIGERFYMDIYEKLGVRKVINACGTLTKLGGSLMDSSVFAAMEEAGRAFVDITEFHTKAGEYIAKTLGVEAACITNGASGGIAISAAACIAGCNKGYILQLPNTNGLKNEILMLKAHRNLYDQALLLSGGKLIEIGYTSFSCKEMIENSINEKTAMFFFSSEAESMRGSLPLEEIVPILKKHGIPLVVDAAAEIPPVENINKYLNAGADLVIFSGGKEIRGPQSAGFILGRRDLIQACDANCCPHHSIGRSMKIDKETIAGIVRAVEIFCNRDYEKQMEIWDNWVMQIYANCVELKHLEGKIGYPSEPGVQPTSIPRFYFRMKDIQVSDIQKTLLTSDPAIHVGIESGFIAVNPQCLQEHEIKIVINAIRNIKVS